MTLAQFVEEQTKLLEEFQQDWVIRAAEKREDYPDNLVPNAWDEQFQAYKELKGLA